MSGMGGWKLAVLLAAALVVVTGKAFKQCMKNKVRPCDGKNPTETDGRRPACSRTLEYPAQGHNGSLNLGSLTFGSCGMKGKYGTPGCNDAQSEFATAAGYAQAKTFLLFYNNQEAKELKEAHYVCAKINAKSETDNTSSSGLVCMCLNGKEEDKDEQPCNQIPLSTSNSVLWEKKLADMLDSNHPLQPTDIKPSLAVNQSPGAPNSTTCAGPTIQVRLLECQGEMGEGPVDLLRHAVREQIVDKKGCLKDWCWGVSGNASVGKEGVEYRFDLDVDACSKKSTSIPSPTVEASVFAACSKLKIGQSKVFPLVDAIHNGSSGILKSTAGLVFNCTGLTETGTTSQKQGKPHWGWLGVNAAYVAVALCAVVVVLGPVALAYIVRAGRITAELNEIVNHEKKFAYALAVEGNPRYEIVCETAFDEDGKTRKLGDALLKTSLKDLEVVMKSTMRKFKVMLNNHHPNEKFDFYNMRPDLNKKGRPTCSSPVCTHLPEMDLNALFGAEYLGKLGLAHLGVIPADAEQTLKIENFVFPPDPGTKGPGSSASTQPYSSHKNDDDAGAFENEDQVPAPAPCKTTSVKAPAPVTEPSPRNNATSVETPAPASAPAPVTEPSPRKNATSVKTTAPAPGPVTEPSLRKNTTSVKTPAPAPDPVTEPSPRKNATSVKTPAPAPVTEPSPRKNATSVKTPAPAPDPVTEPSPRKNATSVKTPAPAPVTEPYPGNTTSVKTPAPATEPYPGITTSVKAPASTKTAASVKAPVPTSL